MNKKKIELDKEKQQLLIEKIKAFFIDQRGEEIGDLQASMLVDLLVEEAGSTIYNQGLFDARDWFKVHLTDLESDFYSLEK